MTSTPARLHARACKTQSMRISTHIPTKCVAHSKINIYSPATNIDFSFILLDRTGLDRTGLRFIINRKSATGQRCHYSCSVIIWAVLCVHKPPVIIYLHDIGASFFQSPNEMNKRRWKPEKNRKHKLSFAMAILNQEKKSCFD